MRLLFAVLVCLESVRALTIPVSATAAFNGTSADSAVQELNKRWTRDNTYDYIIVGGGTAGLAVGARLSETPGLRVLVLEAGIDYETSTARLLVDVPGLDTRGAGSDVSQSGNQLPDGLDWGFVTSPQEGAAGRRVHYERGRMLGGTSGRNFMISHRSDSGTLNEKWRDAGNPGWGWDDLLPYYEKSINYLPPDNSLRQLADPTPLDPALAFPSCSSPSSSSSSRDAHARRQSSTDALVSLSNAESSRNAPVLPPLPPSSDLPQGALGKGPVHLSYPPTPQPFGPFMLGALHEVGVGPAEGDSFNAGVLKGAQFASTTIDQSGPGVRRSTSRNSYLRLAEDAQRVDLQHEQRGDECCARWGRDRDGRRRCRGDLIVKTQAFVQRILFDEHDRTKAIGVEYLSTSVPAALQPRDEGEPEDPGAVPYRVGGVVRSDIPVYATREVIVCAGAFQSPQLLQVSGIGPRTLLEQHGIPVRVDLPTGKGMHDHVFFGPTYPVAVETLTKLSGNVTFAQEQLSLFFTNGTGILTNNLADVIGFERLSRNVLKAAGAEELLELVPENTPMIEYIISAGFPGNFTVLTFNPNTPALPEGQQYSSILGTLIATQSEGVVEIRSASMHDQPFIDPRWLTSPIDQAVAVATFRRLRQIWSTTFMGQILDGEAIFGGDEVSTTAEILDFVRANLMTVWHASATNKMLPRRRGGVLDPRLRVYGTKGLRVVDASSFPTLPPGHTQLTVYALAEKGADLIKEDHGDL